MRTVHRGFAAVALCLATAAAYARTDLPILDVAVGDFDGDGKPDVAVLLATTTPGDAHVSCQARVYSGATGGFLWLASVPSSSLETSIAAVGDVDGDGATDLAILRSTADPSKFPPGDPQIDVVSGRTGKRVRSVTLSGQTLLSFKLLPFGDGSGRKPVDLVVHDLLSQDWRRVGLRSASKEERVLDPDGGFFSDAVCVGDANGDGHSDLAIVRWVETAAGKADAGIVRVVSVDHPPMGGNPEIVAFRVTPAIDRVAGAIASAGDWNGDGAADLLVGLAGDPARKTSWAAAVFSCKDGKELWRVAGSDGEDGFATIALVGDSDGDSRADVAVGVPTANESAGRIAVYSTRSGKVVWLVDGKQRESLGKRLASCTDADGDGVADLVVLAPGATRNDGAVRILSGKNGHVIRRIDPLVTRPDGEIVKDVTVPKGDRRDAARRLVEARDSGLDDERLLAVLDEWLRDASAARAEIIELLDRLWRDGKLPPKWTDRLKSALMDVAKRPADSAAAASEAVLDARYAALVALQSGAGDPAVVKLLWFVAKDESDETGPRVAAVRGLSEGDVDDAATVADWTAVSKSKDEDVRQCVADNLFRAKAPEFDAVLEPLQFDAKDITRAGAIESQTKRRRPTLLARFDELMEDSYEYVRFFAMYAAGVLKSETSGQPQRVAMILRLLETSDDPVDVTGALLAMTMLTDETFGVKPTDVHVREQDVEEKALAAFVADKTARKQAADAWRAKFGVDCVWTDADRAKTLTKLLASADPANVERAKAELARLKTTK